MLKFPIKNLFIEGPDCAGKTTLIKNIHDLTNYKWHIHDRSQISRSIFSEMYDRRLPYIDQDLHSEISNLNNRFIFMLPEFSIIKNRFELRGDDIHNTLESMANVYDNFFKAYKKYNGYPNVIPCLSVATKKQCEAIISTLSIIEHTTLDAVSSHVLRFVEFSGGESYPLQFTLYDDGQFSEASIDSMKHIPERDYYRKVYNGLHDKINNELAGKNEYSRREDFMSRRFVYTDNSCISFIQFAIRNGLMDFNVVIRSSDTRNIFPHDLKFLYYLASTCYNRFNSKCQNVRLRFNLNSAHIIN
jgi:thymidylate kinase